MEPVSEKRFRYFFIALSLLTFIVVAARCALIPFSHDEVATFYFYIQPGDFIPFFAHPDANGHFLTNLFGWICFNLFGDSPFSLRLPTLLSLALLSVGVYRICLLLRSLPLRLALIAFFLGSWNFLGLYALCRGYGISMSFMILAISELLHYVKDPSVPRRYYLVLLFSQLALAANLTLLIICALFWVIGTVVFYLNHRKISIGFTFINILYAALVFYWMKFGFWLKYAGALYYGGSDNYWEQSFVSLIGMLIMRHPFFYFLFAAIFILMLIILANKLRRHFNSREPFVICFSIFVVLLVGVYLMKKIMGVNYPEDRTGLYFYVMFILAFVFALESFEKAARPLALVVPVFFIAQFVGSFNLRVHNWKIYETFPQKFYELLVEQQQNQSARITIGGTRLTEFMYGFMNYRSGSNLNHCTAGEQLQMHCDFAIAQKADEPWFRKYYDVIGTEKYSDGVLIKRKDPVDRILIHQSKDLFIDDDHEYHNFFQSDTLVLNEDPVYLEAEITSLNAPEHFNAWMVLAVECGDEVINVRTPLNLVKKDWRETGKIQLGNITGKLPSGIRKVTGYIWNINRSPVKLKINNVRLYQLSGEGINELSKAEL